VSFGLRLPQEIPASGTPVLQPPSPLPSSTSDVVSGASREDEPRVHTALVLAHDSFHSQLARISADRPGVPSTMNCDRTRASSCGGQAQTGGRGWPRPKGPQIQRGSATTYTARQPVPVRRNVCPGCPGLRNRRLAAAFFANRCLRSANPFSIQCNAAAGVVSLSANLKYGQQLAEIRRLAAPGDRTNLTQGLAGAGRQSRSQGAWSLAAWMGSPW